MKSNRVRLARLLLTVAGLMGTAAFAQAGLADAEADYENCHFAQALAGFERRAAAGEARAAEIAGQMHYYGEFLYGTQIRRNRERARHWLSQAASGGRPLARALLSRLDAAAAPARKPATATEGDSDTYVPGPAGC